MNQLQKTFTVNMFTSYHLPHAALVQSGDRVELLIRVWVVDRAAVLHSYFLPKINVNKLLTESVSDFSNNT